MGGAPRPAAKYPKKPGRGILRSRAMGGGRGVGGGSDGDEKEGTGRKASRHADQHSQPGHGTLGQQRWKEAEALGVQAIEMRKRVLGEEHPDTLTRLSSLASIYLNQRRLKGAEALFLQVVETEKKVLGEEHPSTLVSMHTFAFILEDQGRIGEDLKLMYKCFYPQGRVLGADHHETICRLETMTRWRNKLERNRKIRRKMEIARSSKQTTR